MNRISIITPIRNGAVHIKECVENVAAQDCEALEHLLVIDARSEDGSLARGRELASTRPHLRVIAQGAGGQSRALNLGIGAAAGPVIGILNVDDLYLPGAIARGLAELNRGPAPGFVYGNCRVVDGEGRLLSHNRIPDASAARMIAAYAFPVNPAAYFYHRAVHDLVGGYDETNEFSMDIDFLLRVARSLRLRHVDEDWGIFRFARGTKTWNATERGELRPRARRLRFRHLRRMSWPDRGRCLRIYAGLKLRHWLGFRPR